jgi:CRISPR-associated protein Csb1
VLSFPNPFVDFTIDDQLADLGHLSALEALHRFADAIFRDSMLDGTLFRLSDLGRRVTDATPNAATALYASSPAALLFGMWDSTGPKGGLGSKFQRALVSEIVGLDAQFGVKVGSRIDPLQIEKSAAIVYEHADPEQGWTLDEAEARKDKGKPVAVGNKGELGRPSVVNHGNVTPSIDRQAGGVTISEAVQTTVLSLAALRKLRFVVPRAVSPVGGGALCASSRSP